MFKIKAGPTINEFEVTHDGKKLENISKLVIHPITTEKWTVSATITFECVEFDAETGEILGEYHDIHGNELVRTE